jgi:deoxyinosine 3'endonuclease (endonuclease V)
VLALGLRPDVLLVNATGRDHPRGAGLAERAAGPGGGGS